MKSALRARLKNSGAVAALVGTRVDWGARPQGKVLPAITLNVIGAPRDYHMAGADRTQQYRVQVDCYGETYASADAVRQVVIACLEPANGDFQASFVERDSDEQDMTETGLIHIASMDFKITHSA